jgi:hypothetical protein
MIVGMVKGRVKSIAKEVEVGRKVDEESTQERRRGGMRKKGIRKRTR